jgi:hypothetical protein
MVFGLQLSSLARLDPHLWAYVCDYFFQCYLGPTTSACEPQPLVEAACTEVLALPTRLLTDASMGPLEATSNSHLEASTLMLKNPTPPDRHWSRFVKEPRFQHSAHLPQDVQKLSSSSPSVPKNPIHKRCTLHQSPPVGDFQSLQNARGPCQLKNLIALSQLTMNNDIEQLNKNTIE